LCKSEHITIHNIFQDIVVTIVLENGTPIQKEVSHLSPTTFSNKLIFFTRNNFQTLIDIVIVDSTYLNMVQCAVSTIMHAMIVATQKKTRSYVKRTSKDTFIPLAIKTYDCLHSHFNSFLTTCVQATIAHDFAIYFSSHNVYFLLLALCVHNLSTCASHCDFSKCYHNWETFLIFFTHHN
jgi:hypothetical protein